MSKAKVLSTAIIGVLALGAIAADTAFAESVGWMVNGKTITANEPLARTALVTENAQLTFGELAIECSTLSGIEPQIEPTNKGSATSIIFGGCVVTAPASCKLEGTTIAMVPVAAEATLDGALAVRATFSPKTKTTFTTLKFLGSSCSFASEIQPLSGKFTMLAPTGRDERVTQQAIIRQTSGSELKIGSTGAELTGSMLFRLLNPTSTWSFLDSEAEGGGGGGTPAGWMVNGKTLAGSESEQYARTAVVTENGKVRFGEISVECGTLSGVEAIIEATNKGSAGSLIYGDCKVVTPPSCSLEGTSIATVPMVAEATLDGSLAVTGTFSPKTKTVITTLKFLGASCDIAGEIQTVTGKVTTLAPTAQDERTVQEAIIRQTNEGELKIGSSDAAITGSAQFKLLDENHWSFL